MAYHSYDFRVDDDPWFVILLWWYGRSQERDIHHATIVYRHGTDFGTVGGHRLFFVLWRRYRRYYR